MELLNIKDLNISFTQYEKGMRQIQLNVIRSLDVTVNSGEMVPAVRGKVCWLTRSWVFYLIMPV